MDQRQPVELAVAEVKFLRDLVQQKAQAETAIGVALTLIHKQRDLKGNYRPSDDLTQLLPVEDPAAPLQE
jgi:hypothetical protein